MAEHREGLVHPVAGRFIGSYLVLYGLFNGNGATFPLSLVARNGEPPAWAIAPGRWISHGAALLFRVHTESMPTDNGDGLGDWLLVLGMLCLSIVATSVWCALSRGRHGRDGWPELPWLFAGLRFVLAGNVSAYAFWKVIPVQFSQLDPTMYFHTYGQASPMGLLWMFMGVSPAYEMFAGWMELLGAAMLLFRRTALAGSLLLLVVLGNVVVLDLAFDVNVKICIIHLWLMAFATAWPSFGRLVKVVVLHRAAPAIALGPPSSRSISLAKGVFVVAVVGTQLPGAIVVYREHRDGRPLPRLAGAYDVAEMRRDGAVVMPLLTDASYWEHVAFGRPGAVVYLVSGKQRRFTLTADDDGPVHLAADESSLTAEALSDGGVQLAGTLDGVPTTIRLAPTVPANELLVSRGFHWVNEGPFMR